jgi:hypothetical protein
MGNVDQGKTRRIIAGRIGFLYKKSWGRYEDTYRAMLSRGYTGDLIIAGTEKLNIKDMAIISFIIAWLCGLVVIGAPGGIGVREVVLFFLLKRTIPEADLIIIVVLHRFCTITTDILSFVMIMISEQTKWLKKKSI